MNLVSRQRVVVRQNVADRVVSFFDPQRGLERLRARAALSVATGQGGYDGGRRNRRATKRWRPFDGSPDTDTLPDLPDLRARSRDLERNVPIATGAVATSVTNAVGDGLCLKASVDRDVLGITDDEADRMEREQEREWELFCAGADFTRVQHLDEMQPLALHSTLLSGDAFAVRRYRKDPGDAYGTKIQLLEADRVSNPDRAADSDTIVAGVEVDKDGVPIGYHVSDRHPGDLRKMVMSWQRVPARTRDGMPVILHLYDRRRPELTRGVPYLAPVIEHLKQLGTYTEAEIASAVMNAMIWAFVKSGADQAENPIIGDRDTDATGTPAFGTARGTGALDDNESKLGSFATINLDIGEDVTFPQPGRPNPQFDAFFLAMTRQIGVALELPQELLIKHFTASYSASRAALEMAWQFFRKKRTWLARRFCQPVYGWMMEEAVASGRLARPGFFADPLVRMAYLRASWIGPPRPSIDQTKDAQADQAYLAMDVINRDEIRTERFGDRDDWEAQHAQRVKEEKMRTADGTALLAQPAAKPSAGTAASGGSDLETQPQPQRNQG